MGGLNPPSSRPTSIVPPLPFSEFVICFQVFEISEPGTGPFYPVIGPFHRLFAGATQKMRAFHTGCRFGWVCSPSLLTQHHHPHPLTDDAQTAHLPCWALTWSPPSCPMHHHLSLTILSATFTVPDHTRTPSTPSPSKTLVESFRPTTSRPVY